MVKQKAEHADLYSRTDSPGEPLAINIDPVPGNNGTPSEGEIWVAVAGLSNGRAGSMSGMHAKDVKAWLRGIKLEEDQEVRPAVPITSV